jgi:hypothetical protein
VKLVISMSATGCTGKGSGLDSRRGQTFFSLPVLRVTPAPDQGLLRGDEVKGPADNAEHSVQSTAELGMLGAIPPSPPPPTPDVKFSAGYGHLPVPQRRGIQ